MKFKVIVATLFLAVACIANANPANAVVDSFNTQISLTLLGNGPGGEMEIGQSGTVNLGSFMFPVNGTIEYTLNAIIPASSQIVFSYNSKGFVPGVGYAGAEALSLIVKVDAASERVLFDEKSSAVAYVSAQFVDGNSSSANMVIQNLSDSSMSIMSFLEQLYAAGGLASMAVTYDVSAVPLPAALPMFGFGLLAVAGLRRRKNAAQIAA